MRRARKRAPHVLSLMRYGHRKLSDEESDRLLDLVQAGQQAKGDDPASIAARQAGILARNEYAEANLALIPGCLKLHPISGRHAIEDLVQAGYEGLQRAVEKYKRGGVAQFSTYAFPWIRQAILYFAMRDQMIRVTRTGIRKRDVIPMALLETDVFGSTSDRKSLSGDPLGSCDYFPSRRRVELDMDERAGQSGIALLAERLLTKLGSKEREVLRRRYGIGCAPQSLREVGEAFGFTKEHIRQIQRAAERRIKRMVARDDNLLAQIQEAV